MVMGLRVPIRHPASMSSRVRFAASFLSFSSSASTKQSEGFRGLGFTNLGFRVYQFRV